MAMKIKTVKLIKTIFFFTRTRWIFLCYSEEVNYKVHIFTGGQNDAGTDANVFLTIYGQNGDSGREFIRRPSVS